MTTIVFIGDSITRGTGFTPFSTIIVNITGNTVINKGVDGDTTPSMLARFATDVVVLKPDYAVIMGGFNDISGSTPASTIFLNLTDMCDMANASGIIPILCTVTPSINHPLPSQNILLTELNNLIFAYGARHNIKVVDVWHAVCTPGNEFAFNPLYTDDDTHPNDAGHVIIGTSVYNTVFPPPAMHIETYQREIGITTPDLSNIEWTDSAGNLRKFTILQIRDSYLPIGDEGSIKVKVVRNSDGRTDQSKSFWTYPYKGGVLDNGYLDRSPIDRSVLSDNL